METRCSASASILAISSWYSSYTLGPAVSFRKSDKESGFDIFQLKLEGQSITFASLAYSQSGSESSTSAHRATFLGVLVDNTDPKVAVHLGHRLTGYTRLSDDTIELAFTDGSTAICDFLVGADGMKSAVRKQFVSEYHPNAQGEGDVVWSGMFAYRALVSSQEIVQRLPNHRALHSAIAVSKHPPYCFIRKIYSLQSSIVEKAR